MLNIRLKKGIITNKQIDVDNFEEVQAKRNSVIKLLTEDYKDKESWNTMSGVTFVLESRT